MWPLWARITLEYLKTDDGHDDHSDYDYRDDHVEYDDHDDNDDNDDSDDNDRGGKSYWVVKWFQVIKERGYFIVIEVILW